MRECTRAGKSSISGRRARWTERRWGGGSTPSCRRTSRSRRSRSRARISTPASRRRDGHMNTGSARPPSDSRSSACTSTGCRDRSTSRRCAKRAAPFSGAETSRRSHQGLAACARCAPPTGVNGRRFCASRSQRTRSFAGWSGRWWGRSCAWDRGRSAPRNSWRSSSQAIARRRARARRRGGSAWCRSNTATGDGGRRPPSSRKRMIREMKTYSTKTADITRKWRVVDADGATLGRLATEVAVLLRGKHKPTFTPHLDTGDPVIVVNAAKVKVTGDKLVAKRYVRHSGYPGGLKSETLERLLARRPEEVVRRAVRGMLPQNRLGDRMIRKLHVYAGGEHPHAAQKPETKARGAATSGSHAAEKVT